MLPASILALGFLVYIGVWAAKQLGIVKKDGKQVTPSDASGAKDPAYWQKEFRTAVAEVNNMQLVPWLEKLTEAHTEIVKLLNERSSIFQRQTDLLAELVDMSRRQRER